MIGFNGRLVNRPYNKPSFLFYLIINRNLRTLCHKLKITPKNVWFLRGDFLFDSRKLKAYVLADVLPRR